jgi:hypothetical protein
VSCCRLLTEASALDYTNSEILLVHMGMGLKFSPAVLVEKELEWYIRWLVLVLVSE